MDEKFRKWVIDLAASLKPRGPAGGAKSSPGTYIAHSPPLVSRSVEELQEQINLHVKYLLFDLEATRRENHYLRRMLERRTNFGEGADPT